MDELNVNDVIRVLQQQIGELSLSLALASARNSQLETYLAELVGASQAACESGSAELSGSEGE